MVETFGCSLFKTTARDLYLSPCYPVSITRKDSKKIAVAFIEIVCVLEKLEKGNVYFVESEENEYLWGGNI